MHETIIDALKLLMDLRKDAHVPMHNKYVFAKPFYDTERDFYFIAYDVIKQYAEACGAKFPINFEVLCLEKK